MQIDVGKQPLKYLCNCEEKIFIKLLSAIGDLETLKGDIVKLQGRKDEYRLKLPPYRIIFKYDKIKKIIIITKIDTRGDAYKS